MLMTIPPFNGTVAAHKLLPAPRAIIGVLVSCANLTILETSAVFLGATITSGNPSNIGVASRLYAASETASLRTTSLPTKAVNFATNSVADTG